MKSDILFLVTNWLYFMQKYIEKDRELRSVRALEVQLFQRIQRN